MRPGKRLRRTAKDDDKDYLDVIIAGSTSGEYFW